MITLTTIIKVPRIAQVPASCEDYKHLSTDNLVSNF